MSNCKSSSSLRLLVVLLCSVPLISLSFFSSQQDKPIANAKDIFACLTQIVVLTDLLTKERDIPR